MGYKVVVTSDAETKDMLSNVASSLKDCDNPIKDKLSKASVFYVIPDCRRYCNN